MFKIKERDFIIAEAESLAAAEVCVEALLKPGTLPDGGLYGKFSGLDIWSPSNANRSSEWIENGKLNQHGEVVWTSNDTRRQWRTVTAHE